MEGKMKCLRNWIAILLLVGLLCSAVPSLEVYAATDAIPTIDGFTTGEVHDAGGGYSQLTYSGVSLSQMKTYEQKLINEGYTLYDQREIENGTKVNRFATYVNGDMMIHLNLFAPLSANQFHVIYGPSDKLVPNKQAGSYTAVVTPSVAIIERSEGLLCMVVQLADGSYFVIDGGYGHSTTSPTTIPGEKYTDDPTFEYTYTRDHERDMETLLEYLQDTNRDGVINSADRRPQVTWMATHADADHIQLPYVFMQTYSNEFDLHAIYYNFPNFYNINLSSTYDETAKGNLTDRAWTGFVGNTHTYFPNAKEYVYHTGQVVDLPGCTLEFLYTPEDLYPNSMTTPNHTCGIWRFCFDGGKTFLVTGDAEKSTNRQAANVLGDYLQSDMLQVIHHGSNGATSEFYNAVDPDICFWPCLDASFYHDMRRLGTYSGYAFNQILRNGERTHYTTSATHTMFLPTLRYDANGGTGTADLAGAIYSNDAAGEGVAPNGTITVATNTFTAPEGKLFFGWATTPDGAVKYRPGDQIQITTDTVLYAVWKAESYAGTCGDNLTWTLDVKGMLTISGTGEMPSYKEETYTEVPWYSNQSSIKQVVIEDGVTSVGDFAFTLCSNLTEVTIGDSVTSIGSAAFILCENLTSVTMGDSVTTVGIFAFCECSSLDHVFYGGTQDQWSAISIGDLNEYLTNATRHYNMEGYTQTGCTVKGVYCSVCEKTILPGTGEHSYFSDCDSVCEKCGAVTRPEAGHQVKHVVKKEATCNENGNIEHWCCTVCGQAWLDAACALNTNLNAVILPAMGHPEVICVEAKDSTSIENGNIEYWYCASCGQMWLDAACTQETDMESVKLPLLESVVSIGDVKYGSLEDAIAAARQTPGADTITLLENASISSWVVVNTEVTLIAEKPITISGDETQTGSMFRVIDGGKLTIQGSKEAPITLVAGKNTTNLVVTNGGEVELINVKMVGNASPSYANRNKARGIFNDGGTITAKSVEIANMKGDGIYILHDGIVNLDDVTITNSGRYGIKVKGILNILNTMNADHALTICGSGNNAIDIENGGKAVSNFVGASQDAALIKFIDNLKKDIHVRLGGSQKLTNISTTAA